MQQVYRSISSLFALLAFLSLGAQDQVLTVDDFAGWHEIEHQQFSTDGRWVSYVLQPGHGDPTLVLYDTRTERERRFERADEAHFSADGRHLVFKLHPGMDSLRAMKLRDVKKDDLPTDTLAIMELASGRLTHVPEVKNFKLPEKWSGWLAYGIPSSLPDSLTKGLDKSAYTLVLHSLQDDSRTTIEGVRAYALAEEAPVLLIASDGLDSLDTAQPGLFRFRDGELEHIFDTPANFEQLTLSRDGRELAWLADTDTTEQDVRPYQLYTMSGEEDDQLRVASEADWMPSGWRLSEYHELKFAHAEDRLYFGIAPRPLLADTNELDEERVQVEVWTTQDPLLYTVQEVRVNQEKKRTYDCVLHLNTGKIVQLATEEQYELELANRGDGPFALAYDDRPYLLETMWESDPSRRDLYRVDVKNGSRQLVARALPASPEWSPQGRFMVWYNFPDTAWYAYEAAADKLHQLTSNELGPFYDELNDRPMNPYPEGLAGWTKDDAYVVVEDRYDLWLIDPTGREQPRRLTEGREERRRYRYIQLDRDERHLPDGPWVLHFFDEASCREGYAQLDWQRGEMTLLRQADAHLSSSIIKAKDAEVYLFTRETFRDFPNLRLTNSLDGRAKVISDANPQQANYRWGTIEHIHWTSLDGQTLRGLLVKPDNFDPEKQYPLIVNFYERSSDGLHRHRAPEAHRSTINYSHYVSQGYVIFNPDVPYRIGYPGESAFNAVTSGVTALLAKGYIDRDRIGVQGHSWGGYQIAYLLTRTDLFRCAESGAPVVNMFSAYGGIRWGSGLSRQFQYERTQSRIGGTPWEYPLRYLENSPLFFMDKVNTPVLILHNDQDGAVPWYQGIEYFTALRRLGQPAWLLNYNDEPHWPQKWYNRLDFQRRMSQYFNYFLLNEPQPRWMVEGVSPQEKGIAPGYEAVSEE